MKLNPDCIRDLLIYIEENQTVDARGNIKRLYSDNLQWAFTKYNGGDVFYSLMQMYGSGLINADKIVLGGVNQLTITDITPAGHDFLENIRKDTNWNKTKETAKKIGSFSLSAIKDIAAQVVSNLIKSDF